MGAFDQDELIQLPDDLAAGSPFLCTGMKVGPTINTKYGEATPAMIQVDGDQWFCVFGEGVLRQARSAVPGDFPTAVRLERKSTKSGNEVKLFVPANAESKSRAKDEVPF